MATTHEFPDDRVHFTWDEGGPDLYVAAQDAVRAMIDHLAEEYEFSRADAYVLSSLCVDLRISEVVDAGQYIVSVLLPLAVFTSRSG